MREWTHDDARRWREGIRLLSQPWMDKHLRELGVPPQLEGQSDLFESIAFDAAADPVLSRSEVGSTIRAAIARYLARIAAATSATDADGLEGWLERHFVWHEFGSAMYVWRAVLTRLQSEPGGMYARVTPPPALERVLPALSTLLDDEGLAAYESQLLRIGPSVTQAELELGITTGADIMLAVEIARNELTSNALHELANSMQPSEHKDVEIWSAQQAGELGMSADGLGHATFLDKSRESNRRPSQVRVE